MPPLNTQKQQQELFDEFVVVKKTRGRFFGVLNKFNKPIFPQHRLSLSLSYETLIIILIGAVLVASIIFSLGVERGRSLNSSDVELPVPVQPIVAAPAEPITPVVAEAPKPVPKAAEAPKRSPAASVTAQPKVNAAPATDKPYTIQVASYKTRDLAEKEISRINAMGYSADIVKKGNYFILCVGSFATKDAAKQTLAAMGKKYKGCLIRKH
jgi:cell division septation protein DedD